MADRAVDGWRLECNHNGKKRERREVRCCGLRCFSHESFPFSSLAREGEGGGAGDILSQQNNIGR
jgi:hypothetical protein